MAFVKLHIFNDPHGFFTNKTIDFINEIQAGQSVFVNTASNCTNKKDEVEYCNVAAFLKKESGNQVKSVIFHSYNYFNRKDVFQIKSKFKNQPVKFIWIFWSHEYYQLPELTKSLYQKFSRRFYLRRKISFYFDQALRFFKREANTPFYFGINSFRKTFKEFDLFSAFLECDYEIVMKDNLNVPFSFIAYLTVKDFPEINLNFAKEKKSIMIGHSGAPILNHYEVIQQLAEIKVSDEIFIPLSYGKKSYMDLLKKEIEKFASLKITLQTDFLPKDEYYRKIDEVGYFILNSTCQQALGNIVFFLWNGTKVFLQKNTSTYKTLKEKSFHVFSIEEDLDAKGLTNLTVEQKQHNHTLISEMLSEENVKSSWLYILNFADES